MRILGVLIFLIMSSSVQAGENSQSLILSGYVPVRADLKLVQDSSGKLEIISNNSEGLKMQVHKRSPASIVQVVAP